MYKVELYVRVRRACMVDGMSTREAARVFGLHRDTVRKKSVSYEAGNQRLCFKFVIPSSNISRCVFFASPR